LKLNIHLSQRLFNSVYRNKRLARLRHGHERAFRHFGAVTLNRPLSPTRIWASPVLNPALYLALRARLVQMIVDNPFLIVKSKGEEKLNSDPTKHVILEIYDGLAECLRTGRAYQTRLDPPPGDLHCCHPPPSAETNGGITSWPHQSQT